MRERKTMRKSWKAEAERLRDDVAVLRTVVDYARMPAVSMALRMEAAAEEHLEYASAARVARHHLGAIEAVLTAEHPAAALAEFNTRWQAERAKRETGE